MRCLAGELQERLHKKLDAVAAARTSPRKPAIAGANELAALKDSLAACEADAAAMREQVMETPPPFKHCLMQTSTEG